MKSKYIDAVEIISWLKSNWDMEDIVEELGKDDVIKEFSAWECKERHGKDLLDEFTEEEVIDHFGIETKE